MHINCVSMHFEMSRASKELGAATTLLTVATTTASPTTKLELTNRMLRITKGGDSTSVVCVLDHGRLTWLGYR